jgi:hypothetical protein
LRNIPDGETCEEVNKSVTIWFHTKKRLLDKSSNSTPESEQSWFAHDDLTSGLNAPHSTLYIPHIANTSPLASYIRTPSGVELGKSGVV